MDTVTPPRFTVYRLQYRTNNFIESYHVSLLRLMGQCPQLYRFYGKFFYQILEFEKVIIFYYGLYVNR